MQFFLSTLIQRRASEYAFPWPVVTVKIKAYGQANKFTNIDAERKGCHGQNMRLLELLFIFVIHSSSHVSADIDGVQFKKFRKPCFIGR